MRKSSLPLAVLIFVLAPVGIAALKMPLLGFVALWGLGLYWWRRYGISLRWPSGEDLRPVLARAGIAAIILTTGLWAFQPERLFAFPLNMPDRYILVMIIYPFLSVLPQEIVFRPLFWHLFPDLSPWARIAWNALAFAAAHAIFLNPVAIVLSLIGGGLLAHTYEKHRHLGLVCIEHTLYGWLIFTTGWGIYFYHGTVDLWGAGL